MSTYRLVSPRQPSRMHALLESRNFRALAKMASERIGQSVDPASLQKQCDRFAVVGDDCWSDSTFCHWVLCRAVESLAVRHLSIGQEDIRFEVEMHCFAIWFTETPEQLERLRNENIASREAEYARSKLTKKQSRKVRPVNKTAHNVAPFPDEAGGVQ